MRLSKIKIKIDSKTKEECIQKINLMNSLDVIETIDIMPRELSALIDDGYSVINATFTNKKSTKKPIWAIWNKDKQLRKQAIDVYGNKEFKDVYNRTFENVVSAETMSFDIENEYDLPYTIEEIKNDLIRRNLNCFNIIYETYSHNIKGDRYRLLGTLNRAVSMEEYNVIYKYIFSTFIRSNDERILTNANKPKLYDKIYLADISCIDISKINFPGKVIEVNDEQLINVDDILNRIKDEEFELIERTQIKEKKYNNLIKKPTVKPIKRNNSDLSVDRILDFLYAFGQVEIDYNYRYIVFSKMFKITDLLEENTDEFFSCSLPDHDEVNPSAYIYIDSDGFEKYHCWGCGKRYNIIQLIKSVFEEELGLMTDLQFFKYIESNTQLKFGSLYQKESYSLLCAIQDKVYTVKYNKDLNSRRKVENKVAKINGINIEKDKRRTNRSQTDIKEEIIFNYLSSKNLINFYNNFLLIARNNITFSPLVKDDTDRFSFFYSTRALTDSMQKMTGINYNNKSTQDKLKALAKIGIIEYANTDKLEGFTKTKAFEYKKKHGYKNHINFFIINNILDIEILTNIANVIQSLKGVRNKSIRDMTFEQAYRDLGAEQAYKIYPQFKDKNIELEDKNYKHIRMVISKLLLENEGYFTDDMLKKRLSKRLSVKEKDKLIKTYINQIMKEMDISYSKVNKKVRDSFHTIPNTLSNKQYVYIKNNLI